MSDVLNTKPIRILCVFAKLDRGGAESMCMNLYRQMDRDKVQFDFVKHYTDEGAYEAEIVSLGGKVFTAPRYKIYNYFSYCAWWKRFLKAHPEYQIIHGHFYTIASVYLSVAKKIGIHTIAHSHSIGVKGKGMLQKIKNRIALKVSKYADTRFACSDAAGKWLFKGKDFKIIPNAIDTNAYRYNSILRDAKRKELGLTPETLLVGTVGNINQAKNPDGIISIFKSLLARCADIKLLWVGGGELLDQVRQQIIKESLQDHILLLGAREDVHELMQAMDVFILPSLWEGLGMVLIEAQAAGLPCVSSKFVPRDVAITDLCRFLALDDLQGWSDAILGSNIRRKDTFDKIKVAGYDVSETAARLQQFYLSLNK